MAANEAYLQAQLQSGVVRACPGCRTPIVRNEGCLHMSCHCGQHFWYAFGLSVCVEVLDCCYCWCFLCCPFQLCDMVLCI